MNTAIYMLRAFQIGMHIEDMERLSIGMVNDIIIESGNDNYNYKQVATQNDFDKF